MLQTAEVLWREEKYRVMYHSQQYYNQIRHMMRDRRPYVEIQQAIDQALTLQPTAGSMRNTLDHMWGYFKKIAQPEEKQYYLQLIAQPNYEQARLYIKELAVKYNVIYLLQSRILD